MRHIAGGIDVEILRAHQTEQAVGQGMEDQVRGGDARAAIGAGGDILNGVLQNIAVQGEIHAGGNRLHRRHMHRIDDHVCAGAADENAVLCAVEEILVDDGGRKRNRAARTHHQRGVGDEMSAGAAEPGGAFRYRRAAAAAAAAAVTAIAVPAGMIPAAAAPTPAVAPELIAAAAGADDRAAGTAVEGKILIILAVRRTAAAMGERTCHAVERAEAAGIAGAGTIMIACHRKFLLSNGKTVGKLLSPGYAASYAVHSRWVKGEKRRKMPPTPSAPTALSSI